ncbi:RNA 2',3'-cyclic phosphodiesterase [Algicola sagamiensis]|uniref:RNA 2',3'-cyclic phosphodiesterase n=1 Tax=Algicola sagamiensis TaxID=163869 RepID=UPI0003690111|nr:RNA 2',3'-cyclic phosphodiesterase [Algicola sagamiensis]
MHTKRLFFAFNPPDDLKLDVHGWCQQSLQCENPHPIPYENYHVTALFLGAVSEQHLNDLYSIMETFEGEAFDLCFDEVSYWKRPRILCLTTSVIPIQAKQAAHSLAESANQYASPHIHKTYRPHITLSRKEKKLIQPDVQPQFRFHIDRVGLFESRQYTEGTKYICLKEKYLLSQ